MIIFPVKSLFIPYSLHTTSPWEETHFETSGFELANVSTTIGMEIKKMFGKIDSTIVSGQIIIFHQPRFP